MAVVSSGADFENGLLKHSKDPFLKGLRFLNSLRSNNVAEPTTYLSRCKQLPFSQDSTFRYYDPRTTFYIVLKTNRLGIIRSGKDCSEEMATAESI